jgi:hypothetical protein
MTCSISYCNPQTYRHLSYFCSKDRLQDVSNSPQIRIVLSKAKGFRRKCNIDDPGMEELFASAKGSYWWYSRGLILIQGRVLVLVGMVIQCCHASHWKGIVAVLFGSSRYGEKGECSKRRNRAFLE